MATITTTPVPLGSVTQVTVSSGDTIYYGTDNTVSPINHDGSIVVTASHQFTLPAWIVSASSSVVAYNPALAVQGAISRPVTGLSTLGTVIGSMVALDVNGNAIGVVPIYNTIT